MNAIQIFAYLKKDTIQLKLQMGTAAEALTFLEGVFLALDFGIDFKTKPVLSTCFSVLSVFADEIYEMCQQMSSKQSL